jgi:DNA (cytosine-5)-methyltransferase 1
MMTKLKVLDLFSGIGGFSHGLDNAGGFETVAFCEIEPFPRKVIAKHWLGIPCYEDVTKLTGDILRRDGISVDVITGGFPCQDISVAGKQAGIGEGTRSGLWSEIVRLIGELAPRYVIVENVAALLSGPAQQRGGWFGSILGDLAECRYDAEWENIPAAAVGAPHRRERVWIVAYPNDGNGKSSESKRPRIRSSVVGKGADNDTRGAGLEPEAMADPAQLQRNGSGEHRQPSKRQVSKSGKRSGAEPMANADKIGLQGAENERREVSILSRVGDCSGKNNVANSASQRQQRQGQLEQPVSATPPSNRQTSILGAIRVVREWSLEPDVGRVANGVPQRVDRLKGLGNAVVPKITELIGRAIMEAEGMT